MRLHEPSPVELVERAHRFAHVLEQGRGYVAERHAALRADAIQGSEPHQTLTRADVQQRCARQRLDGVEDAVADQLEPRERARTLTLIAAVTAPAQPLEPVIPLGHQPGVCRLVCARCVRKPISGLMHTKRRASADVDRHRRARADTRGQPVDAGVARRTQPCEVAGERAAEVVAAVDGDLAGPPSNSCSTFERALSASANGPPGSPACICRLSSTKKSPAGVGVEGLPTIAWNDLHETPVAIHAHAASRQVDDDAPRGHRRARCPVRRSSRSRRWGDREAEPAATGRRSAAIERASTGSVVASPVIGRGRHERDLRGAASGARCASARSQHHQFLGCLHARRDRRAGRSPRELSRLPGRPRGTRREAERQTTPRRRRACSAHPVKPP